jgi:hypothetical protein
MAWERGDEKGERLRGVKTNLSLLGKAMDLFKTSTSDTALQDAIVLLGIDIERFVVQGMIWLRRVEEVMLLVVRIDGMDEDIARVARVGSVPLL